MGKICIEQTAVLPSCAFLVHLFTLPDWNQFVGSLNFFSFCAMKPEPDEQTHTALSVFRLREIGLMRRYGDQAPFSNEKEAVAM